MIPDSEADKLFNQNTDVTGHVARRLRIAHPASGATAERPARSSSRWLQCCLPRCTLTLRYQRG